MTETWTVESLRAFEEEVRDIYAAGKIRAAIHLSRGNETQLLEIFKGIDQSDYVFSTYRSHYHALLHGVPRGKVMGEIHKGHSIHLTFPEHYFYTSAIVAGCLPIALGTALGIKRRGTAQHVWCFVGDMAGSTGAFHEAYKYAYGHNLPIRFVVECNDLSTNTPTSVVWGSVHRHRPGWQISKPSPWFWEYCYDREGWPHVGAGVFVNFDQAGEWSSGGRPDVMG